MGLLSGTAAISPAIKSYRTSINVPAGITFMGLTAPKVSDIQGSVDFIRLCLAYEVTVGSVLFLAFSLILASMGLHWGLRAIGWAGTAYTKSTEPASQDRQAMPKVYITPPSRATTSVSNQGSGGDQGAGGPGHAAVNQTGAGHEHAGDTCKPILPHEFPPKRDPKDTYYDSFMREVSPLEARLRCVNGQKRSIC